MAAAESKAQRNKKGKSVSDSLKNRMPGAFSVFEDMTDGIVVTDLAGTVCFVNHSLSTLLGYQRKGVVGEALTAFIDEPDGVKFREFLSRVSSGGSGSKVDEFTLIQRNGSRVPMHVSLSVIHDSHENFGQVVCIARDISRYKVAMDILRHHEQTFRSLFEQSNDAIIIHDLKGQILDFNQRAIELLRYDRQKFLSMTVSALHPESERNINQNAFKETSRTGQVVYETRIKRADGGLIDVEISSRMTDKSRGIVQGVIRDITKRKQAEAALKQSQVQLFQAQKMEALGTLVAGVAHEINNPINSLMFNVTLIQGIWKDMMPVMIKAVRDQPQKRFGGLTFDVLTANLTQVLSDMDMAVKRVVKIVSGLKDFSRMSSPADKTGVSINTALENALRLAQTTIRKSGVELEVGLSEGLPPVLGDLHSIEQIFLNLVINAIQAIDHDHGKVAVRSGFRESDSAVFVSIADNGGGVSPDIADRIFDPFVTDKHASGGSGLGLSVSYSLVQALDGEITFDSHQESGTTFTVAFPTRQKKKQAKILIVEDDRAHRKMLMRALSKNDAYHLETAENGSEALIKLGTYAPDLLILDVFMPEINGLEVCRVIRQEEALWNMKVLIITGFPMASDLKEIAALGFTHVVPKPLDIQTFGKKVERILSERKEGQ